MTKNGGQARCAVILGPYTSGKTTLLEALLHSAEAVPRKGTVDDGTSLGDASQEARARSMSVEPNVAHCTFMGEDWSFIDCPGSVELQQDSRSAIMAADIVIVVSEPEADKAVALSPLFRMLDELQIPHLLFVNKMDRCAARVRDLLSAFQQHSSRPLVLRQVPIHEGDSVTGVVDLVSERAWKYKEHENSALIQIPAELEEREAEARQEMLESLADFDDGLLEQLLEDQVPPSEEVYQQLTTDLQGDLLVPVFLGSSLHDNGILRLWKALRHEAPGVEQTAERLGLASSGGLQATVVKTYHLAHSGKVSLARVWDGTLSEGSTVAGDRLSGLSQMQGGSLDKLKSAKAGDLVALGRMDSLQTGDLVTESSHGAAEDMNWPATLTPVYAVALEPAKREDEVKLSAALHKMVEEDLSLSIEQNQDTQQLLLWGQGDIHLKIAVDRLRNRYKVEVDARTPTPAYKETIAKGTDHHARHKRQSGGHGQFADIKIKIKPLPRGTGFQFEDKITGGAVPRQYIPAVEHGIQEYLHRGPLGFPVVDLAVTLYDGQHHAVDSSDMAFKTAGRIAMTDALPDCDPVLLEPIYLVTIHVPNDYTNRVHSLISGRRGQILGFDVRPGWDGWDEVTAHMPQSEILDLIIELRSLSQGVGTFLFAFDHLQELRGKSAERVVQQHQEAAQ
ncbi:elongation factor G [Rhodovibrionaceae bacterium A322]